MRTSILIDKTGSFLNGNVNLILSSPINGNADYTLFNNQISVEFFNSIVTKSNGVIVPDFSSKILTGLSGTLTFTAFSSIFAPYPFAITSSSVIDIATSNLIPMFTGTLDHIGVSANTIVGCNYINIYIDRN